VIDPDRLVRHCLDLVAAGGLLFVTVPFSYPYHRDPIDTMYRPNPAELAELLCGARVLDSTILGTGVSYRNAVRERPWLLLRHLWRLPIPFLSFEKWQRSMAPLLARSRISDYPRGVRKALISGISPAWGDPIPAITEEFEV
jgi:hypothetical protein